VKTADIFGHPALERATKPAIVSLFAAQPYDFGHNDLQAIAQSLCPDVATALGWLSDAGLKGKMTGSGSAVFALGTSKSLIDQVPTPWLVRNCSNLEAHPLQGWAFSAG
jgi:4-diphosphocytidyl-2-C-methyl-D-erythritol kinase